MRLMKRCYTPRLPDNMQRILRAVKTESKCLKMESGRERHVFEEAYECPLSKKVVEKASPWHNIRIPRIETASVASPRPAETSWKFDRSFPGLSIIFHARQCLNIIHMSAILVLYLSHFASSPYQNTVWYGKFLASSASTRMLFLTLLPVAFFPQRHRHKNHGVLRIWESD